jgi:PKD repeat protein
VRYTPAAPGSTLDFNAFVTGAQVGTCFYADDVFIAPPANDAPTAALTVSPGSGAIDLGVTADASGSVDDDGLSPIESYSFDWGDGSSATGPQSSPTATHTYTAPGMHTVTVTVRDTAGLTSTATYDVTVRDDPPQAAVSATPSSGSGPLQVTADASGSSDVDATPIASYRFDWGDGSVPTADQDTPTATHTYADPGDYTLTVVVTDTAGNESRATTTVRVFGSNLPPNAALSVSPASGVVDLDVTADASASTDPDDGIASYRFEWGDGTAGTGEQPGAVATHTYRAAGTYTVTVTVQDTAGQTTTATTQVVVKPNLVGNPGFESSLTGWNTSGSGANVTLARVAGGHSGSWSARLANGGTTAQTCALNDAPDWVRPSSAGSYRYSIWVRGDTAGATIKAKVTEYSGSTNVGSAITTATLTTSWQKLTVDYAPTAPGSSLDFMTYITNAKGTCFYADDAAIGGP